GGEIIKTLIDSFRYPRKGPGMLWEACAEKVRAGGGEVRMGCRAEALTYDDATKTWTITYSQGQNGSTKRETVEASSVVSSAPLRELVASLSPAVSEKAQTAAKALRYRDFLTVMLILKDRNVFDDNWIYVHDPHVSVGRIQNFKSWSPEM